MTVLIRKPSRNSKVQFKNSKKCLFTYFKDLFANITVCLWWFYFKLESIFLLCEQPLKINLSNSLYVYTTFFQQLQGVNLSNTLQQAAFPRTNDTPNLTWKKYHFNYSTSANYLKNMEKLNNTVKKFSKKENQKLCVVWIIREKEK